MSDQPATALTVKFWGTRASYPFFLPTHSRLGGDTSCVELSCAGSRLFIDAGTGLMHAEPTEGHDVILMSHFHLDHVLGLPYFLGKKKKGALTLASAACTGHEDLLAKIDSIYGGAAFPVSLATIRPEMQLCPIGREGLALAGWDIRCEELNHPGTAFGYRVRHTSSRSSAVYLSDHEHGSVRDEALCALAEGAALVIWDSSYDDRSFEAFRGWGHSTWQEGVRFMEKARAARLALSHHDPARDDGEAAEIETLLRGPEVFLAHDRMVLQDLPADR